MPGVPVTSDPRCSSVHTPLEEFENGARFHSVNAPNVYTKLEEFKDETITDDLHLCLSKTWAGEYHDYNVIVYENLRFQNVLCPQKRKTGFLEFLRFEELE